MVDFVGERNRIPFARSAFLAFYMQGIVRLDTASYFVQRLRDFGEHRFGLRILFCRYPTLCDVMEEYLNQVRVGVPIWHA